MKGLFFVLFIIVTASAEDRRTDILSRLSIDSGDTMDCSLLPVVDLEDVAKAFVGSECKYIAQQTVDETDLSRKLQGLRASCDCFYRDREITSAASWNFSIQDFHADNFRRNISSYRTIFSHLKNGLMFDASVLNPDPAFAGKFSLNDATGALDPSVLGSVNSSIRKIAPQGVNASEVEVREPQLDPVLLSGEIPAGGSCVSNRELMAFSAIQNWPMMFNHLADHDYKPEEWNLIQLKARYAELSVGGTSARTNLERELVREKISFLIRNPLYMSLFSDVSPASLQMRNKLFQNLKATLPDQRRALKERDRALFSDPEVIRVVNRNGLTNLDMIANDLGENAEVLRYADYEDMVVNIVAPTASPEQINRTCTGVIFAQRNLSEFVNRNSSLQMLMGSIADDLNTDRMERQICSAIGNDGKTLREHLQSRCPRMSCSPQERYALMARFVQQSGIQERSALARFVSFVTTTELRSVETSASRRLATTQVRDQQRNKSIRINGRDVVIDNEGKFIASTSGFRPSQDQINRVLTSQNRSGESSTARSMASPSSGSEQFSQSSQQPVFNNPVSAVQSAVVPSVTQPQTAARRPASSDEVKEETQARVAAEAPRRDDTVSAMESRVRELESKLSDKDREIQRRQRDLARARSDEDNQDSAEETSEGRTKRSRGQVSSNESGEGEEIAAPQTAQSNSPTMFPENGASLARPNNSASSTATAAPSLEGSSGSNSSVMLESGKYGALDGEESNSNVREVPLSITLDELERFRSTGDQAILRDYLSQLNVRPGERVKILLTNGNSSLEVYAVNRGSGVVLESVPEAERAIARTEPEAPQQKTFLRDLKLNLTGN